MAEEAKTEEKPAEKKLAGKPAKKAPPFSEAGWNTFGAVLLAGFAFAVFGMGMASLFEPGIATVMTLVGGIVIFALSGLFAKMAIQEFGRELTKKAPAPAVDAESEEKEAPKGRK